MSKSEVTQRLMCSEGKVESQRLRTGKLAQDDWSRLTAACDKLMKAPIYVDDTGSTTMMDIRSKSRRLKSQHPNLGLIIVDYLQLMTSGKDIENRVQEVSQISRQLKVLARDLDVPILALSQLSRAVEQRHDKRPILSDLRESGSIEQDADLVMFIYRDEYYNPEETDQQGLAEVHIAKHRNGPTDTVKLSFLKRYAKFADLATRRPMQTIYVRDEETHFAGVCDECVTARGDAVRAEARPARRRHAAPLRRRRLPHVPARAPHPRQARARDGAGMTIHWVAPPEPPPVWREPLLLQYPHGMTARFDPRGRFLRPGDLVNGYLARPLRGRRARGRRRAQASLETSSEASNSETRASSSSGANGFWRIATVRSREPAVRRAGCPRIRT